MKSIRERLRVTYDSMKSRCNNPKNKTYKYYGGKGVKICEEWGKFKHFYEWAINNGYEPGLSIERKNTNSDYSPSNCEWIEMRLQAKNQTSNHKVTINGITKNVSDWAKESGIHRTTLNSRIKKGITGEALLSKPKITGRRHTQCKEVNQSQK